MIDDADGDDVISVQLAELRSKTDTSLQEKEDLKTELRLTKDKFSSLMQQVLTFQI